MGQLKVRDIMTTQVVTLSPDDSIKAATKKLAVENISGAPVVDDNYRMVGIISENDILDLIIRMDKKYNLGEGMLSSIFESDNDDPSISAALAEFSNTRVSDIMTRTVLSTSPDSRLLDLLKAMIKMDISRVPVLEKGVLIGVATRTDIMFALYKKKI